MICVTVCACVLCNTINRSAGVLHGNYFLRVSFAPCLSWIVLLVSALSIFVYVYIMIHNKFYFVCYMAMDSH